MIPRLRTFIASSSGDAIDGVLRTNWRLLTMKSIIGSGSDTFSTSVSTGSQAVQLVSVNGFTEGSGLVALKEVEGSALGALEEAPIGIAIASLGSALGPMLGIVLGSPLAADGVTDGIALGLGLAIVLGT